MRPEPAKIASVEKDPEIVAVRADERRLPARLLVLDSRELRGKELLSRYALGELARDVRLVDEIDPGGYPEIIEVPREVPREPVDEPEPILDHDASLTHEFPVPHGPLRTRRRRFEERVPLTEHPPVPAERLEIRARR